MEKERQRQTERETERWERERERETERGRVIENEREKITEVGERVRKTDRQTERWERERWGWGGVRKGEWQREKETRRQKGGGVHFIAI